MNSSMDIVRTNELIERLRSERDEAVSKGAKVVVELRDMKADRDEWRSQHENLLAIYRKQTVALEQAQQLQRVTANEETVSRSFHEHQVNELRSEVERLTDELENERARGIHTCHSKCQRPMCVKNREIEQLRAENKALRLQVATITGICDTALEKDDGTDT